MFVKHKRLFLYLCLAYSLALFVEYFSAKSGDSKLFQSPLWLTFFLIWYGLLYTLAYKFMKYWPLWKIGIVWAVLGPVIEIFLFRGSFLISDLAYGLIFLIPFWVVRRFYPIKKA
jgi:hypothetical protein